MRVCLRWELSKRKCFIKLHNASRRCLRLYRTVRYHTLCVTRREILYFKSLLLSEFIFTGRNLSQVRFNRLILFLHICGMLSLWKERWSWCGRCGLMFELNNTHFSCHLYSADLCCLLGNPSHLRALLNCPIVNLDEYSVGHYKFNTLVSIVWLDESWTPNFIRLVNFSLFRWNCKPRSTDNLTDFKAFFLTFIHCYTYLNLL